MRTRLVVVTSVLSAAAALIGGVYLSGDEPARATVDAVTLDACQSDDPGIRAIVAGIEDGTEKMEPTALGATLKATECP